MEKGQSYLYIHEENKGGLIYSGGISLFNEAKSKVIRTVKNSYWTRTNKATKQEFPEIDKKVAFQISGE